MAEPYRLRRWKWKDLNCPQRIFTCARPGRSKGPTGKVPDKIVAEWIANLPMDDELALISLLGEKPNGTSEYSFYSFSTANDFGKFISDQAERPIAFHSFPTTDFKQVPKDICNKVKGCIEEELLHKRTVVIVDSGGMQRTNQLCTEIGLHEDSRKLL